MLPSACQGGKLSPRGQLGRDSAVFSPISVTQGTQAYLLHVQVPKMGKGQVQT